MMCGLPHHTSVGYELYITKLLLTLNQKLQLHGTYKVFFVLLEVSQLYILMECYCGLLLSSSNVMLVMALGEYFGTQFPWQLSRYPLSLNTCDKSRYNEPIFTRNSKSYDLWVTTVLPEPFKLIEIQQSQTS